MPTNPKQAKLAIALLIKEVLLQIDEVASIRKSGGSANISREVLKDMCSVLKELDPEYEQIYFDYLLPLAGSIPAPARRKFDNEYAESSANAKKRMIERIRFDLKKAV